MKKDGKIIKLLIVGITLILLKGLAYSDSVVILAKKVNKEIPLSPEAEIWKEATPLKVPLFPQVVTKPRIYKSSIKEIEVKAIHNSKEIAFLVEWEDSTKDTELDIDKFSDAVALEFPSSISKQIPSFAMGDDENPVNIWYWKAAWQESGKDKKLVSQNESYTPNFTTKNHLFIDNFLPGVLAKNPVSKPVRSSVENLVAQGFGSATDMEKTETQNIEGVGEWKENKWSVVFKRSLVSKNEFDVNFKEGDVIPIAFAVWNGSEGQRGGRKSVSTWYYLGIEKGGKGNVYLYAFIAFLAVFVVELIVIFRARQRA